jgi:phosphate transport system substrate-binding protein
LAIIILIGAALCAAVYYSPAYFMPAEPKDLPAGRLQVGGTSAAQFLMDNHWGSAYRKTKNVQVAYESTGSTQGVDRMIEGQFSVGFTHAPLTDEQRQAAEKKGGPVLHIPVVICSVIPIYNLKMLKDSPPLKLTGELLADIFLGKITRWNDPALRQLNEGVELPDMSIAVVHRADSSGTTFVFTDYLNRVSEAWRKQVGAAGNKINWPVGEGKDRNYGVAAQVYLTDGAIGYVDGLFAGYGDLKHAAVRNADGDNFVHADHANMTAALQGPLGTSSDDLTFSLTNRPGRNAYPICGCVWAVCFQRQPSARKTSVQEFLTWLVHDGQKFPRGAAFAPLPESVVKRAEQKIATITATQ